MNEFKLRMYFNDFISVFPPLPYIPSPPSKSNVEKLSNSYEDSFKRKLTRRNKYYIGNADECDICGQCIGDLESARILDRALQKTVDADYEKIPGVPLSINDAENGLLLCSCCHTKYDKIVSKKEGRSIQITEDGTIILSGNAKRVNYQNLNGKKVPWARFIGVNKHYPSRELLRYALQKRLNPLPGKRVREIFEDLVENDDDDDDDDDGSS